MVRVARDVAVRRALDRAGRMRETVPDRLALTVLVPRAFDLVRRGRRAPEESARKRRRAHALDERGSAVVDAAHAESCAQGARTPSGAGECGHATRNADTTLRNPSACSRSALAVALISSIPAASSFVADDASPAARDCSSAVIAIGATVCAICSAV